MIFFFFCYRSSESTKTSFFWSLHWRFTLILVDSQKTCNACYVLVNGARRLIRIPAPDYLIYPTDPPQPRSPRAAQSQSAGEEWQSSGRGQNDRKKPVPALTAAAITARSILHIGSIVCGLCVWLPD